jgi:ISXO2-like transposase domain/Transposase zinc-ribbon domain
MVNDMSHEPKSLQEAVFFFANPDNCIDYLAIRRWPDGRVLCPTCNSDKVKFNADRRIWQCSSHHAKRQFSIKVGTIMEDSAIPLDKWLMAMWMVTNCKNGISSYEIAKDVKVTQKSAWFMLHRIRLAMQDEFSGSKLSGHIEVDETFIGGKARNMHLDKRERRITGTGGKDKTIVFGALERGGKIRTAVVTDRKLSALHAVVKEHVEAGSALYSDALGPTMDSRKNMLTK